MSNKIVLLSTVLGSALLLGGCALSAESLYPAASVAPSSAPAVSPTPSGSPVPSPSLSSDTSSNSIDKDLNGGGGADNLDFNDITSQ